MVAIAATTARAAAAAATLSYIKVRLVEEGDDHESMTNHCNESGRAKCLSATVTTQVLQCLNGHLNIFQAFEIISSYHS